MWEKLIQWSSREYSDLPWRKERTLYSTLVSEIMLQQTTVGTVKNHFHKFLLKFPDLHSLSKTSNEEMLIQWKGLGYYRRAKNLLTAAKEIQEKYQGKIPEQKELLVEIKGIGEYTANAILSIGLDQNTFAVDANLERVLARIFNLSSYKGSVLKKEIHQLLKKTSVKKEFVKWGGRSINEALMDLGRTICRSQSAACEICPVSTNCQAFRQGKIMEEIKAKKKHKKLAKNEELELLRFLVLKEENILAYKKEDGEWLGGQWEIPTYILKTSNEKLAQYPESQLYGNNTDFQKKAISLGTFETTITKYKIKNYLYIIPESVFKKMKLIGREYKFCLPHEAKSNLSTASIKALNLYHKSKRH